MCDGTSRCKRCSSKSYSPGVLTNRGRRPSDCFSLTCSSTGGRVALENASRWPQAQTLSAWVHGKSEAFASDFTTHDSTTLFATRHPHVMDTRTPPLSLNCYIDVPLSATYIKLLVQEFARICIYCFELELQQRTVHRPPRKHH